MWPVRTSTMSPGSTVQPRRRPRPVEVVAGDRVAVVEVVDAVEAGHVEQDAPGGHRAEGVDAQLGGARPR